MQALQLSTVLMLGMLILAEASSPEKENTCSVIACGTPGANGLPGRDGRDGREGPKGEMGDSGLQGLRGLQGPPGKAGPVGLKGDKGPLGPKGEKGSSGDAGLQGLKGLQGPPGQAGPVGLKGDKGPLGPKGEKGSSEDAASNLQQQVNDVKQQLKTLQDSFNKYKKALVFHIGKEVGRKFFVTDGFEYNYETAAKKCSGAGGLLASPKNAEENLALQEIVQLHNKVAFLGINDRQTEGTFRYPTGELITYSNWKENEPNNNKEAEDCSEVISSGKWNDISCTDKKLVICEL
ncbi:pulmonary surfactant-associated protein D-like isoform X1 [Rhinatrema bivittatum]|uniref:pulmonary surfactant-associated protein D-like isoform X1 n=1 Tax=Rhinatrema bivittatum TaxID=194408 RepID=UPI00112BD222|nr:pulmonary surfactant-associated protein D-like isoform X1 [Rhinatrema bivittatum]